MYKKSILFSNILILWILVTVTPSFAVQWYNTDWKYRRLITCANPIESPPPYPAILEVYYNDGTKTGDGQIDCAGKCQSDFDDVIFTEDDGITQVTDFDIQNKVDGTSIEYVLRGDGNKYCYYGNETYTTNYCFSQYGYSSSTHSYVQQSAIYSATDNKLYMAWADASYAPWATYYDTITGQWAPSGYQIAPAGMADLHAAPAFWRSANRFHVSWGAHASDMYYQRSIVSDVPPDLNGDITSDFTDFTEVDPASHISVAAATITATNITRNETAYVYEDKGAGYFSDSFCFNFSFDPTVVDNYAILYPIAITAGLGEWVTVAGNKIGVRWYYTNDTNGTLYLYVGTSNDSYVGATVDTGPMYCTLFFDTSVGTYGTLYLYIYSDSARTTLLDTLAVASPGETYFDSLRYLNACMTYNSASANACTMTISNFVQTGWLPKIVMDTGTYPRFTAWDDSGEQLYISYREGTMPYSWNYKLSTDDGATWGSSTVMVEAGEMVEPDLYAGIYVDDMIMDADGDWHIVFHWMYDDGVSGGDDWLYEDVYYAVWDESDSRWENISGTDLGASITQAEAITNCTVYDSTDDTYIRWARITINGDGYPAMAFNDQDGGGSHCYFTRWNGSSWESPVAILSSVAVFELFYISGAGASSVYDFYTGNSKYTTSNGGTSWSSSTWLTASTDGYAARPIRVLNGSSSNSIFTYMHRPYNSNYFPYTCRPYPEPANTFYYHTAGYLYTFKDLWDRDATGVMLSDYGLTNLAPYQLYKQVSTVAQESSIVTTLDGNYRLKFAAGSDGDYLKIWTAHDFDVSTWEGYVLSCDGLYATDPQSMPTFGTVADGTSWDTTTINLPTDGIWLNFTDTKTKCDVSVQIGGAEVINDDDNNFTGPGFKIYVEKDAGGDVVTVYDTGAAANLYTGVIPSSGHLADTVNIFMGQYASGGASGNISFDDIYFSPYSGVSPQWTTVGSVESLGSVILLGF